MYTPQLSVVIPAYNEERYLENCLIAISSQKTKLPYEIIVVDNASSDHTLEIARRFPHIKIISEKRKGIGRARQTGFNASKAPIIASTDADCRPGSDWLEKGYQLLNKNKHVTSVGGYTLFYDNVALNQLMRTNRLFNLLSFSRYVFHTQVFSAQNMFIRRRAWKQIGGFDTSIISPLALEDVQFCIKLSQSGSLLVSKDLVVFASARRYNKHFVRAIGQRAKAYYSYWRRTELHHLSNWDVR